MEGYGGDVYMGRAELKPSSLPHAYLSPFPFQHHITTIDVYFVVAVAMQERYDGFNEGGDVREWVVFSLLTGISALVVQYQPLSVELA